MTSRSRPVVLLLLALLALVGAGAASGSILVAENASAPTLRVADDGTAEVGWKAGGTRQTMTIPLKGRVQPGGTIAKDVSTAGAATIPFKRVVRTGPNGVTYALQAWRTRKGGPLELRFARWQGLSDGDRERVRQRWRRFNDLPPEQQDEVRAAYRKFQQLSPERKRQLRNAWDRASPAQRREMLERMRERQRLRRLRQP